MMQKSLLLVLVLSAFAGTTFAQRSRSVIMPESISGGDVTFTIDTPTVSYKPYHDKTGSFQNSGTLPIFAYARLETDPAAKMTMVTDTNGVKVDTVEIKSGTPITFGITLSSTLKPSAATALFASRINVFLLTKFQGIYIPFASDSIKFTATFPPYSSSGVAQGPSKDLLLNISPNPSSGPMTFTVSSSSSEPVTIELFDALGNRKADIARSEQVNGLRNFHFDAAGLPSGSYFVKLTRGTQIVMKRIILEK